MGLGFQQNMLFCWLLVFILKFGSILCKEEHRRVIRQDELGTCATEDDTIGRCIDISSCPSLLNLLNESCSHVFAIQTQIKTITYVSDPLLDNAIPPISPLLPAGIIQAINQKTRIAASTTTTEPSSNTPFLDITTSPTGDIPPTGIVQTANEKNHVIASTTEPSSNTEYSLCGKTNKKITRHLEGHEVMSGDWPWIVALGYRTNKNPGPLFKCAGSLLSNQWVITAAHCVSNLGILVLTTIRIGDLDLNDNVKDNASPIDVPFDRIILHPEYSSHPFLVNDIALIRLKHLVTFTDFIRPICILSEAEHRNNEFYSRRIHFVIGWGPSNSKGRTNKLKENRGGPLTKEECSLAYSNQSSIVIDERVICLEDARICLDNTGGLMIMPIGERFYLAGVGSYGFGCYWYSPRIYTKVAHFADWIKRTAHL